MIVTCRDETKPLPWLALKAGTGMLVLLQWITHWLVPAPLTLTLMTLGYMRSQILYCVTKLRIPEVLAAGPLSPHELARQLGMCCSVLCLPVCTPSRSGAFLCDKHISGVSELRCFETEST